MDPIKELLKRRLENIYPNPKALEKVLRSGKKLTLYQGFDPTSPNLHIGHLVGLLTLKQFQQLGHQVIFLIGDFTARVGDPTGKSESRRALSETEVAQNAATYQKQASLILKFTGPKKTLMKFNSQWLNQLSFGDILKLTHHFTIQQLLERDMFQNRLKENKEVYLNEFMYPLMQAYDSVALKVDLEVGGSDQMFNMLAGRKLVKELLGKEKFVTTTKLLTDKNGKKIGKTEGNAINLTNPPTEFFGQIMSLPDDAVLPCLQLITELSLKEISSLKKDFTKNPMVVKKRLGFELVKMLHDKNTAQKAQSGFEQVFQNQQTPQNLPTLKTNLASLPLLTALTQKKIVTSNSEAKRLFKQQAVSVNDQVIIDPSFIINRNSKPTIVRIGRKRWLKIIFS